MHISKLNRIVAGNSVAAKGIARQTFVVLVVVTHTRHDGDGVNGAQRWNMTMPNILRNPGIKKAAAVSRRLGAEKEIAYRLQV